MSVGNLNSEKMSKQWWMFSGGWLSWVNDGLEFSTVFVPVCLIIWGVTSFAKKLQYHRLPPLNHAIGLRMTCARDDMINVIRFSQGLNLEINIFFPFIRGTPKYGKNQLRSTSTTDSLVLFLHGHTIVKPVAASTNVQMATWPSDDFDMSSRSMWTWSPILQAGGTTRSKGIFVLGLAMLAWLQTTHEAQYFCTSEWMPGHVYECWILASV